MHLVLTSVTTVIIAQFVQFVFVLFYQQFNYCRGPGKIVVLTVFIIRISHALADQ